uniref:Uncharacterized protein n=1 Tax=Setaria viridis TaxID=4556 RepID=A0A4U6T8U5_SETVI|nr:hypothetical protein SEVIR_9G552400v2 [Setaria viridis]
MAAHEIINTIGSAYVPLPKCRAVINHREDRSQQAATTNTQLLSALLFPLYRANQQAATPSAASLLTLLLFLCCPLQSSKHRSHILLSALAGSSATTLLCFSLATQGGGSTLSPQLHLPLSSAILLTAAGQAQRRPAARRPSLWQGSRGPASCGAGAPSAARPTAGSSQAPGDRASGHEATAARPSSIVASAPMSSPALAVDRDVILAPQVLGKMPQRPPEATALHVFDEMLGRRPRGEAEATPGTTTMPPAARTRN